MDDFKSRRTFLLQLSPLIYFAVPGSNFFKNLQQQLIIPRIGFFTGEGYPELEAAFMEELGKLGFNEGKNINIERRYTRPNSTDSSTMAVELSKMDLNLIFAISLPLALEIRKANPAMPMVIGTCPGMVSNGFAQSLEHPGGIYTGMDELPPGVTSKRVLLLKTAAPAVTKIALLSSTPGKGGHEIQLAEAEKTTTELGIVVKPYKVASKAEIEKALSDMVSDGMNGMLNFQGGLSLSNRKMIVDFAGENNIPAIYQATLFAEAGGLMTWAPDLIQQLREAAHLVGKILNGAKPGDLPIKHPENYYLTLNKTAANKIGLTFPETLLSQAAKVLP
ncbi:MAG: ABC transporter substrate-binding protein [Flavisolibacter sp.]